ncbi:c-type cytochrome [Chloroflexota bacterium]
MKKFLPLLAILMVAVLVLSACGEPAYLAATAHGDDEHSATTDHADDETHEEDGEHAEDADERAEDEAAEHDADAEDHDEAEEGAGHDDDAESEEHDTDEGAEHDEDAAAEGHDEDEEGEHAETAEAEEAALVGDPANGETLFNQMIADVGFACATCHRVDSELQLIGPGLLGVAARAGEREPGATPQDYVLKSIMEPDALVVEGFADTLMPEVYTEIFSEAEIADLVAYVLSLEG